jgi:multisubunit Na+/H+ antiporter MnhF subunit
MMSNILDIMLTFLLLSLAIGTLMGTIRLFKGPSHMDRLVALEFLGGLSICALIWMGLNFSDTVVLDVALIVALLGFLSTCSMAKWLERENP